jgi:putative CocE/NonD family hydrolase
MIANSHSRAAAWVCAAALATIAVAATGQTPEPANEMPEKFVPVTDSFDHVRREVEIPMRDGVKLHTVVLVPKGAKRAAILLTRTPYSADKLTSLANSGRLLSVLQGYDNPNDVIVEGGYIRVVQDVRGRYRSEGEYVMNRPLSGPLNATKVDHATDTYDTIDWLVKNVPESNGRVGILGISYDGFLPLMALVNPHPALKVAVPMNAMVDGWRGDDWFHNGAFRQQNFPYIYGQQATRKSDEKWWSSFHDDYDLYMDAGSAGELAHRHGMEQLGFYRKLVAHPAYDAFWQEQAMDRVLARQPLSVPVMLVHGLWDQEDIYGNIAVYQAIKPKDVNRDKVFLVIGPWYHGQQIDEGSSLGAIRFGADTAAYFRQNILRPFLDHYLKDEAPPADVAPVTVFETGTNRWRRLSGWPAGCDGACPPKPTPLYLQPGLRLGFEAPAAGALPFDEYVSDPAKPVPFRARPIQPVGYGNGLTWEEWLVDDQREASGRTDVLSFVSETLTAPLSISGQPAVNLVASTSGSDGDFVVKLIDVYPDEVPAQRAMGGYQLAVAMDIFRGRYRESLETPKPLKPNVPLAYRFALPATQHVFLPGHRLMVQVQSSWFPLYDRNPQTYVDNIFLAKSAEYRKATIRVYHAGANASYVELPVVK